MLHAQGEIVFVSSCGGQFYTNYTFLARSYSKITQGKIVTLNHMHLMVGLFGPANTYPN